MNRELSKLKDEVWYFVQTQNKERFHKRSIHWEISSDFDYLHLCIAWPDLMNKKGKSIKEIMNFDSNQRKQYSRSINLHGYRHLLSSRKDEEDDEGENTIPLQEYQKSKRL